MVPAAVAGVDRADLAGLGPGQQGVGLGGDGVEVAAGALRELLAFPLDLPAAPRPPPAGAAA